MGAKKPNRQQLRKKQAARAARAAELARRKRARERRLKAGAVVALIAVVGLLAAALLLKGGDSTQVTTSSSTIAEPTSSALAALASAAGKPCVPVAGEAPPGAPAVPVKVGPPPTKLIAEDLKPGSGAVVAAGQNLTVNYIGVSCSTGKIFDSSYSRNEPATFPLTGVIPGWQEGIPGMKVGGQRLLGIPPDKGYGAEGGGDDIAPDETLWFVVEVIEAKPA